MNKFPGLLGNLFHPVRVAVPDIGHGNAGSKIEILIAVRIPEIGSFPMSYLKAGVGVVANEVTAMFRKFHYLSFDDLRANSLVSENFEQNAVG